MADRGVTYNMDIQNSSVSPVVTLEERTVLHLCGSGLASMLCNHLACYIYVLLRADRH